MSLGDSWSRCKLSRFRRGRIIQFKTLLDLSLKRIER